MTVLNMTRAFFTAIVFASAVAAVAAPDSTGDGSSEPADSGSRTPAPERLDEVFSEWDRPGSPGCAVGVTHRGKVLFEKGYGTADLDHDVPITPSTIFDIGSVSKQFTAASLVLLAERGELSLDDDIQTFLPELPDYGEPISIRQLIHHTSGMRDYLDVMSIVGWPYEDMITDRDIVRIVAQQASLNFRPGEEYTYSNSGYMMLGVIVKRVTGSSLGEFAAREIFAPLEMNSSLFYEDRTAIIPNRATGYAGDADGGFRQVHNYNFAVAGDGQLYTTVGDLLLWNRELDRPRVWEPHFAKMMLTRGMLDNGESIDYAFGLSHGRREGRATVSHGGSSWGFRAYLERYPEQELSVAVLCNADEASAYGLAGEVSELFLAEIDPGTEPDESEGEESQATEATKEADPGPNLDLTPYEGSYACDELQVTHEVIVEEGRLAIRVQTTRGEWPRYDLEPVNDGTFAGDGFELVFERDGDEQILGFTLGTERARNFWFTRR
jgi:CubicO group peptidase (beta-lactamase class C family)